MPEFSKINALCTQLPDDSRHFPKKIFTSLHKMGLLQISLPYTFQENEKQLSVFTYLFEIGKASLSVGRIYEGHINAIKLIEDYGSLTQQNFYFQKVKKGKLFGVWNTEKHAEVVTARKHKDSFYLEGAKTFCSGGLHIDYAIVTAEINTAKQLFIVPLKDFPQLKEDWTLWQPMGMKNSVSCRIDFTGIEISSENLLGRQNVYHEEPWFSGGAMRFAAVQLGGAEAVLISALDHLRLQKRTKDPYQQHRMGMMAIQIQSGKFWLEKSQKIYDFPEKYSPEEIVNFANMMRCAILEISENILSLAEHAIGVQGFMENHPLERLYRDLKVYLKQPGPDLALQNVGSFTFESYKL
ncbi:acyl-CoA dehydrogenase family protein [Salegentibacter sp. Hel_I_6]|uniref:acyl-CoA dehydrogenase family protein n=1 Tax=Salegentibacter sp. Hel_I_6 TaxID=1250278 RepID=UPI00068C3060|nr:acyl-CoA dehydrogenase family protein [Salegentibacter sp. Hel_I_6]